MMHSKIPKYIKIKWGVKPTKVDQIGCDGLYFKAFKITLWGYVVLFWKRIMMQEKTREKLTEIVLFLLTILMGIWLFCFINYDYERRKQRQIEIYKSKIYGIQYEDMSVEEITAAMTIG